MAGGPGPPTLLERNLDKISALSFYYASWGALSLSTLPSTTTINAPPTPMIHY